MKDLEWKTKNWVPKEPKPVEEICRICNGKCKGEDTHEKTRESWKNQSPVKVMSYEEFTRARRNPTESTRISIL